MFRILRTSRVCWFAALLVSGSLWAAMEHEEATVYFDGQLTLAGLLDTTLKRHPQAGVLQAQQGTADAEISYGRNWFPEATRLSAFHLSDRQFDDFGAFENEVALDLPLWLPGEKNAQSLLGDAAATARVSSTAEFRWRVSAVLRLRLWNLMRAQRQWQLALEQEQRLSELLEQVNLFTDAGDLSRADQLAAVQELAIWKAETMTMEADYQDAIREYMALTGIRGVPSDISEALSGKDTVQDDHPALRRAMDTLAEASASNEVRRQGNSARPSLQVFWRGFSGDRSSPDVNALGIGLSVPLGKSPRMGPELARSNERLAGAEAELIAIRRELDLQLHEARHMLNTTRLQLENSRVMLDAALERHRLDQLAFELGEFSVREWLRRLSKLKSIQRSHEILLLQEGAAIASYNHAVGESL